MYLSDINAVCHRCWNVTGLKGRNDTFLDINHPLRFIRVNTNMLNLLVVHVKLSRILVQGRVVLSIAFWSNVFDLKINVEICFL